MLFISNSVKNELFVNKFTNWYINEWVPSKFPVQRVVGRQERQPQEYLATVSLIPSRQPQTHPAPLLLNTNPPASRASNCNSPNFKLSAIMLNNHTKKPIRTNRRQSSETLVLLNLLFFGCTVCKDFNGFRLGASRIPYGFILTDLGQIWFYKQQKLKCSYFWEISQY